MMNCQQFHDQLFDYLDGSLPPHERIAAEEHLGRCVHCQGTVQAHQTLTERFKGETAAMTGAPGLTRRVEAALAAATAEPAPAPIRFWQRLAWPMGMAAAVVLTGGLILYFSSTFHGLMATTKHAAMAAHLSLSYCEPTYTFRQDTNGVVDALICAPRVVEENLSLSANQKPILPTQERKTSL